MMTCQFQASATLPPGKQPRYPLDRKLGGLQSRFRHYEEEINPLSLSGIEPRFLDRPACSLVALYRLSYADSYCKLNKIKFLSILVRITNVQCCRILYADAFLKASHNLRQVFLVNTYVILAEFFGIRNILNFAHKVRPY
jgi:hypothetical protein